MTPRPREWMLPLCLWLAACVHAASPPGSRLIELEQQPVSISALAWQQISDTTRLVSGRVVTIDSLSPLGDAVVELADSAGRRLLNDPVQTDGSFVYKVMRPGVYILTVKRLGYATARGRIEVLADHRVTAVAVMVPQVVRLVE